MIQQVYSWYLVTVSQTCPPLNNPFRNFTTKWVLLWLVLGFVIIALLLAIFRKISPDRVTEGSILRVFFYLWIVIWIYRKSYKHEIEARFLFGRVGSVTLRVLAGFAPVYYVFQIGLFGLFYYPVSYLAPGFVESWVFVNPFADIEDSRFPLANQIIDVLTVVLVAPVIEELFFRGILLNRWATKWGFKVGMLASTAAFALLHPDIMGSFVFGLSMCIFYWSTRSLFAPILIHSINNATSLVLYELMAGGPVRYSVEDLRSNIWTSLICFLVGLPVVAVVVRRHWRGVSSIPPYMLRLMGCERNGSTRPDQQFT